MVTRREEGHAPDAPLLRCALQRRSLLGGRTAGFRKAVPKLQGVHQRKQARCGMDRTEGKSHRNYSKCGSGFLKSVRVYLRQPRHGEASEGMVHGERRAEE